MTEWTNPPQIGKHMVHDVAQASAETCLHERHGFLLANQITTSSRVFLFSSPCTDCIDPSNGCYIVFVSVTSCLVAVGDSVVGHNCHVPTHVTQSVR